MRTLTRREFLELGARLAAVMGLGAAAVPRMADALEELATGAHPVLWLQGQSCSGCTVSFLNSADPAPMAVLTRSISLLFHPTLSAATGRVAMDIVTAASATDGYILVVEGAIPAAMPSACLMGGVPVADLVAKAAARARVVIALGACAAFGGIPAAEENPTGAAAVPDYLTEQGAGTPFIRIPGCPPHPDWFVGTLAHLVASGMPELDDAGRPVAFFAKTIHEQCPRLASHRPGGFARSLEEDGCLRQLGCRGPFTGADCTVRLWNNGANTCINAGAPCIGCAAPDFARSAERAFHTSGGGAGPRGGRRGRG